MTDLYIFLVRFFIAAICSMLLMRMFRPDMHIAYSLILALFIVGGSYFSKHFRKKKK